MGEYFWENCTEWRASVLICPLPSQWQRLFGHQQSHATKVIFCRYYTNKNFWRCEFFVPNEWLWNCPLLVTGKSITCNFLVKWSEQNITSSFRWIMTYPLGYIMDVASLYTDCSGHNVACFCCVALFISTHLAKVVIPPLMQQKCKPMPDNLFKKRKDNSICNFLKR